MRKLAIFTAVAAASVLTACGSSSDDKKDKNNDGDTGSQEQVYQFNSFLNGSTDKSSVSYSGQTARHILINDFKTYLGKDPGLSTSDAVLADVLEKFIYRNESTDLSYKTRDKSAADLDDSTTFTVKGDLAVLQTKYATDKNLVGKIAGQDKSSHLQYTFIGWDAQSVTDAADADKPLAALFDMLTQYSQTAANASSVSIPLPSDQSASLDSTYVNAKGIDFQQLINKFLLMSITFSQGTADYLKTDFGKAESNSKAAKDGKAYTTAEHKWDEAFGYLGAAINMPAFTDLEARAKSGRDEYKNGYFDINKDGKVDIGSELNLGQAVNCAKRDIGATKTQTDYTKDVFDAFYNGRKLINDAKGDLKTEQLTELDGYAKTAALTWEKCIAATSVHYINEVIADLDYDDLDGFKSLAKHWSEMLGFTIGLQFNPESPLSEADLKSILADMGMAPVLADGSQNGGSAADDPIQAIADYKAKLVAARDKLANAYDADFQANKTVW